MHNFTKQRDHTWNIAHSLPISTPVNRVAEEEDPFFLKRWEQQVITVTLYSGASIDQSLARAVKLITENQYVIIQQLPEAWNFPFLTHTTQKKKNLQAYWISQLLNSGSCRRIRNLRIILSYFLYKVQTTINNIELSFNQKSNFEY